VVLGANLDPEAGTRPAWIVLALGLAVLAGAVWRRTVRCRAAAA